VTTKDEKAISLSAGTASPRPALRGASRSADQAISKTTGWQNYSGEAFWEPESLL